MEILLSIAPGTTLDGEGAAREGRPGSPSPGAWSPAARALLEGLLARGASEEALVAAAAEQAGYPGVRALYALLFALHDQGLLTRSVRAADGRVLARLRALAPGAPFSREPVPPERSVVLSRFAYLRREEDELVLESPTSRYRVTLTDDRALDLLARLVRPLAVAAEPGSGKAPGMEDAALLELLWQAEVLDPVDASGKGREDEDPALSLWEFHDLLFHARSRAGRHDLPYGGTFRWRGIRPPLPALKEAAAGAAVVELAKPHLDRLRAVDAPFTHVLEARRSRREHGEPPITLAELGEFLFRSSRVREVGEGPAYPVARRVYPGGGAAYELEVYVAAGRCRDLVPGLYHYRPESHRLARVRGATPEVERLLTSAAQAAGATRPVQVLLLLAARFGRVSWKYSSVAYATILKDVGVVYQTMYLVATAMGLAACALGGGNSDLFAASAGTDYYAESSVGELLLGRPV